MGLFLEAGAEPEGKENASEEAGQISHQFAESDDEKRKSHLGKGNFEMRNAKCEIRKLEIGECEWGEGIKGLWPYFVPHARDFEGC